jgi:hypothetical protein
LANATPLRSEVAARKAATVLVFFITLPPKKSRARITDLVDLPALAISSEENVVPSHRDVILKIGMVRFIKYSLT